MSLEVSGNQKTHGLKPKARACLKSGQEPFVDRGDADGGFVADGELVVAGGHGAVALEPVNPAFDGVAQLVQVRVEAGGRPPARPLFLRWRTWSAFSGMVQAIRAAAGRRGWRGTRRPYRPAPGPGGCAGPPPGRGTRMRPSTAWNCGLSPRWPAVTMMDRGFCRCSHARCTLVVSPPRDRPRPWSAGSSSTPPGGSACRSPFSAPGRVLVRPGHRGIDRDVPGDQPGRIGPRLRRGHDRAPGTVRCQRRNKS